MESVCLTMRLRISDCELRIANCELRIGFYSQLSSNPQSEIRNPKFLRLLRSEKSCPARWLPRARWERRFLPFLRRHQLLRRHHERAPLPAPLITRPGEWRAGQTRHRLPRV